ncbi:MAG: acyl carrier protein [Candidatus Competibacteraceae bacterium]|nr:acyl carrier protein [Candidatus Competibacteraceae bacterium]
MINPALREKIERRKRLLTGIKEELIDRLRLDFRADEIDDDTFLFGGGLALDSIAAADIIVGLQFRFGVILSEEKILALQTVNTLADFLQTEHAGGFFTN